MAGLAGAGECDDADGSCLGGGEVCSLLALNAADVALGGSIDWMLCAAAALSRLARS